MAFFGTFYSLTSPKEIQLRRAFSQQYLLTPNVIKIISKESDESLISRYVALLQRSGNSLAKFKSIFNWNLQVEDDIRPEEYSFFHPELVFMQP